MTISGKWMRKTPLSESTPTRRTEVWEYLRGDGTIVSFGVDVTIGKPLDVMGLKRPSLEGLQAYASSLQKTANELYALQSSRRGVMTCPCCEADTVDAVEAATVFGISYKRCRECAHVFVAAQPTQAALNEFFTKSGELSSTYTDRDSVAIRLEQIAKPKLDWITETYRRHRGREGTSVLDVGAAGGHFVEVCRRSGVRAEGYELSEPSRRFAKEVFNLDLRCDDFLAQEGEKGERGEFDILTFWGLLEYTPEPKRFLEAAHQRLDPQTGMLVIEVPRFDCFGTAVQKGSSATVVRHLDPTSHVNCFSDASLATALVTSGFRPVAAWYFGMDAYELLVQLALQLDGFDVFRHLSHWVPGMQASLDSAKLCDDIIVAAVPLA